MKALAEREDLRTVALRLGEGTYSLRTRLDEESWDRVKTLVGAAFDEAPRHLPREQRLVMACLEMALSLDRIGERLKKFLREETPS